MKKIFVKDCFASSALEENSAKSIALGLLTREKVLAGTLFLIVFFPLAAWANNISVANVSITSQSTANKTANVQFDITWNNSWRNSVNYDAAWVFIKYSTDGGTTWHHATLAATGGTATSSGNGIINPTGYVTGSGTALQIIVPTEATSGYKGAFLQRSANGTGTVNTTGVQLVWNWGADGLTASSSAQVNVYAIEMVYVPTGSFYVGDGTTASVAGQFCTGTTTTSPFPITSTTQSSGLTLGGGGSNLGNNNTTGMASADDWGNSVSKSLPAAFPQGYNAYYMMKYDVTQDEWKDFLNALTRTQQNALISQGGGPNLSGATSIPSFSYVMSNTTAVTNRNRIQVSSIPSSTAPMTFNTPVISNVVSVLVVAGGGGGNGGVNGVNYGDGGGGGTVVYNGAYPVSLTTYTVTVGAGGAGVAASTGGSGRNSVFGTITATGGTGTANTSLTGGANANYSGGTGSGSGSPGGGGAGGAANGSGINGGAGYISSISGTSTYYGSGGSSYDNGGGAGTTTSGGGAGSGSGTGGAGGTNTGGGGGGGDPGNSSSGGAGGSGVVIVSFTTGFIGVSATGTYSTTTSGGNTIYTFTGNGSFTVSSISTNPNGEWIAANYLNWTDAAAYAAWAGLRPMTELEYEKAARGNIDTGTAGEYAWGSTSITQATSIVNLYGNSETAGQTGNGLTAYGNAAGVTGPMRAGFAATSTTSRAQAGASYWGIMDLSGNLDQRVVTTGNPTGRGFTGTNGTGVLDPSTGDATNSDWPGYSGGVISTATGSGSRGGDWLNASGWLRISDRTNAANTDNNRRSYYGARFVRTAP